MAGKLDNCEGFEWDEGNSGKNWNRHRVTDAECEEVFFNLSIIIVRDAGHSVSEARLAALGRTDADRLLFIAFTMRRDLIRVISGRDMTRNEQRKYAEKAKRDSDV